MAHFQRIERDSSRVVGKQQVIRPSGVVLHVAEAIGKCGKDPAEHPQDQLAAKRSDIWSTNTPSMPVSA
jgi:hypothetical protein